MLMIKRLLLVLLSLQLVSTSSIQALQEPYSILDASLSKLVSRNLSIEDILEASSRPRKCLPQQGPFAEPETRLIYLTPWNTDGYAYTALHSERISHVAPVWYQVRLSGSKVTLEGDHNVQNDWLASLAPVTKVVPRFEVLFASVKEIEALIFFPRKEAEHLTQRIIDEVVKRGYDGVTLEVPYTAQMTSLINVLGKALHDIDKELVLVIPAQHDTTKGSPFTRADALGLQSNVDFFSLNAYDHATAIGQESGNAPLPWLRTILDNLLSTSSSNALDDEDPFSDDVFDVNLLSTTVQNIDSTLAGKVLLGLNFYGYTCTTDGVMNTITAKEYRDLVEFSTMSIPLTIEWHAKDAEHRMDGKFWSIWYPTPLSVLTRAQLAREYGIGLSVWEAGQGMEYLWDVLF